LKDLIFCEGDPDHSFTWSFEQSIFNLHGHRILQCSHGWTSFYALAPKEKKIYASLHFNVHEDIASSPLRAPYGSAEFAPALPADQLFAFLQFVESQLRAREIKRIVIKSPPENYSGQLPVLTALLLNLEFRVINSEIAAAIHVRNADIGGILHRSENRRLEKATVEGLQFKEVTTGELPVIYEFIAKCRADKNYGLSMSSQKITEAVTAFPDRYVPFAVYKQKDLVAASICIRINQHILYDFYHDHAAEFDHLSPVVMLVSGIYGYCYRHNISLLDLGTSAVGNLPNFNLLKFKLLLGAKPSNKFTFQKDLQ
jgi:hypothetical protein